MSLPGNQTNGQTSGPSYLNVNASIKNKFFCCINREDNTNTEIKRNNRVRDIETNDNDTDIVVPIVTSKTKRDVDTIEEEIEPTVQI